MKISKFLSIIIFFPYIAVFSMPVEDFNREKMIQIHGKVKVEGYWASHQDPVQDWYKGKYPWPQPNPKPWKTQDMFLKRLAEIEKKLLLEGSVLSCKGFAPSRLEPDESVGSREFNYIINSQTGEIVKWPEGFGSHYVKEYNVKPSKEFYSFVMNNSLENEHSESEYYFEEKTGMQPNQQNKKKGPGGKKTFYSAEKLIRPDIIMPVAFIGIVAFSKWMK